MAKFQLNQMIIAFSILVLLAILPLGGGMLAHGRHQPHQPKQKPLPGFPSSEQESFPLLNHEENSIFKDQTLPSELPVRHPKQALERLVQMLALTDALHAPAFPQNHHEYSARPERRAVLPVKQLHELNAVLETLEDVDREIQKAIGEKDGPVNISLRFPNAKERNDGRDETQGVASNPSKPKSVTKKSAVALTKLNSVAVAKGATGRTGKANVPRRKFPRDSFIF